MRSRTAVLEAARTLFLRKGYAGTTMDDIAEAAGLTKRTLYNNYPDKDALFTQIVADTIAFAESLVRGLHEEFTVGITAATLRSSLHDLARRMALGIVRTEVVALRRLIIGETRTFPLLAKEYFEAAPGRVMDALAGGFRLLSRKGMLRVPDGRRAAAQFAYLVVGEPLDRAVLLGVIPPEDELLACAADGVETFLARYAPKPRGTTRNSRVR